MTTRETARREKGATPRSVSRNRLDGVCGARRLEPAGPTDERRQDNLVDANQEDEEFRRHCFDMLRRLKVIL